jgi:hypothetical protein
MNQVLLVTYDLKTPGKNYTPFYEALKLQGPWWHYLTSTWLIVTTKSSQDVYLSIASNLTVQDFVLVIPVTRPYWGYLPKEAWDWIDKNI